MKQVAVLYAEGKPHMEAQLAELNTWLAQSNYEPRFLSNRERDPLTLQGTEWLMVMGGDGTFLHAARLATQTGTPILGVDLGRLGFLSEVAFSDLPTAFERLVHGDYQIEERAMMHMAAYRGSTLLGEFTALNEGVVSKGAFARIVELAAYVDDAYLTTYSADGLIISTPTGSTGYALSAGAPLLTPELPVLVLAPICPHSLSARPIVLSDASVVRVAIEGPRDLDLMLTADGQEALPLRMGDEVHFSKSPHKARLIKLGQPDFFARLQSKLHWGATRRPN
jgi:NAD+ kinase